MTNLDEIKARRARLEWDSNKSMHDANWDKHHFGKHAPTDIDWLTQEVERLRAENEELETYTSKLIYSLTDGLLSKRYEIEVIEDETQRQTQVYIDGKLADLRAQLAQAEAERDALAELLSRSGIFNSKDDPTWDIRYWLKYAQQQAEKQRGAGMIDLKTTATELNSPDCRYTYDALREICVYLAGKALSLERGNKNLRSENSNLKQKLAKTQRDKRM